jgi:hypothetical protein
MRQHYSNNKQFGNHLTRFNTIMQRSTTMTDEQKQEIREELKVIYKYDQFIDENPDVQKRVERGRAEGEIRGLQKAAMAPIKRHFPTLLVQAKPLIEQIQ